MYYMGIDLHKKYFISTLMDQEGKVLGKSRVSTDRAAIKSYLQSLDGLKPTKAVLEAGFNWSYFYDQLADEMEEVCLAHPLKTRLIAEARIKTDSIDSEALAHLLRSDLIPRAYTPSLETRDLKNLLRFRIPLVRIRISLKNKVHSVLDRHHVEDKVFLDLTDKFGKTGMKIMRSLERQRGAIDGLQVGLRNTKNQSIRACPDLPAPWGLYPPLRPGRSQAGAWSHIPEFSRCFCLLYLTLPGPHLDSDAPVVYNNYIQQEA